MARINIDIGTLGNPATGDTLRGAMQKINSNFIEVYDDLAGASLGGLFTNNATNGDVKIQTNGTGIVEIDQLQINGDNITSMITNGDLTLSGNGTGGVEVLGAFTATSVTSNTISSNGSNAALTLSANGTGNIVLATNTDATGYTITADEFIGEMNGYTIFDARNVSGSTITKGEAVYISGLQGNTPTVAKAQANASGTMPAFGLAVADISNNNNGQIVTFGSKKGLRAADFGESGITFTLGDTVYVSASEAGKLTNVPPAGESNFIQNIGRIERATPTTNITIKVGGAGRTNATPALDEGNIFIGNSSNQSTTASLDTEVGNLGYLKNTGTQTLDNLTFNDNIISTASNADLRLEANGTGGVQVAQSGGNVGFFGTTPVAQQSAISYTSDGSTKNDVAIDSILTVLRNYGLIGS